MIRILAAVVVAFVIGLIAGATLTRGAQVSRPVPVTGFVPFPSRSAAPVPSVAVAVAGTPRPTTAATPLPTIGTRPATVREPEPAKPARGHNSPTPKRTPKPVHVALRGVASWFAAPVGTAAAGPALRASLGRNWRGTEVTVTANGHSVRVVLSDWCACPRRLIDLSRGSFARLADPSRGLVRVSVR